MWIEGKTTQCGLLSASVGFIRGLHKMGKEGVERRRHQRFQMPSSAFAGLSPYYGKLGRILDLSMGGLAFHYIGTEEPNGSTSIDIFMNDLDSYLDFYLRNVTFKTISDFPVVTDGLATVTLRRMGVQFGKLTQGQRAALEHFIEEHAIGEA